MCGAARGLHFGILPPLQTPLGQGKLSGLSSRTFAATQTRSWGRSRVVEHAVQPFAQPTEEFEFEDASVEPLPDKST